MNLSAPFIRRPVATLLLSLAIMLLGGVSFGLLPVISAALRGNDDTRALAPTPAQ